LNVMAAPLLAKGCKLKMSEVRSSLRYVECLIPRITQAGMRVQLDPNRMFGYDTHAFR